MNEIVKIHNDFNAVTFKKFNSVELDLLMVICSKMKDEELKEVTFTFEELKELSKYNKKNAIKFFVDDVNSTFHKLITSTLKIKDGDEETEFILFTERVTNVVLQTVKIKVNEKFSYMLNTLTSNFTRFELEEFTNLSGKYSKQIYRLLKQFRSTGMYRVSVEEFREKLDIPTHYKMTNIDTRVLKPAIKELSPIFKNLKIEKEKYKRSVMYFIFTFDKENIEKPKDIEPSEPLKNSLEPKIEREKPAEKQKEVINGYDRFIAICKEQLLNVNINSRGENRKMMEEFFEDNNSDELFKRLEKHIENIKADDVLMGREPMKNGNYYKLNATNIYNMWLRDMSKGKV